MHVKKIIITVLFVLPLYFGYCNNETLLLELPEIFSDHMVLQRNTIVPIWGKSQSGSKITVKFLNQRHTTIANKNGEWRISLDKLTAGGPFKMKISSGKSTVVYKDILVGEVWLGSGQSNMEWAIYSAHPSHKKIGCDLETQEFIGKADYPEIRISSRSRNFLNTPNGGWVPFSEKISKDLPATMACLAIRLQREHNVPVGIIVRAISASASVGWLDRNVIDNDVEIQKQINDYKVNVYPSKLSKYNAALANWEETKKGSNPIPPARPGYELQSWFKADQDSRGIHYKKYIAPIAPFAIAGFVWDQGESGTGIATVDQITITSRIISSWRKVWENDNLPFFYFDKRKSYPQGFNAKMKENPKTFLIDTKGLSQDLHPPDKAAYSERLFNLIMKKYYN